MLDKVPVPVAVLIPMLNPNESEVLLADLKVKDGQPVASGEVLAVLETTKSTGELCAESAGFVLGLRIATGMTLHTGDILCYLSTDAHSPLPERQPAKYAAAALPSSLRITAPALALARQFNLDLAQLPPGKLVTEFIVRAILAERQPKSDPLDSIQGGPAAVIVYGGGGHGKSLIDLLRAAGVYQPVGVVDDGLPAGGEVLGVPILGGGDLLPGLIAHEVRRAVNAIGGIGNLAPRLKVFEHLAQAGFTCPAIVHPKAVIEPSASLADGVQVFALAYVGSGAQVGFGCIVNTGAILSHDVVMGAYSNVSPGAMLAGQCRSANACSSAWA